MSRSICHVCRSFFWKYFKSHLRKHYCYPFYTISCFLLKPHSLVHKLYSHLYLAHKVYWQMQRDFNYVKQSNQRSGLQGQIQFVHLQKLGSDFWIIFCLLFHSISAYLDNCSLLGSFSLFYKI